MSSVIDELNRTTAKFLSIKLELISWETSVFPAFGEDAQDVINKQIRDDYDIFIGIMGARFGSPTNRFESGTLEEFVRAYSKYKQHPQSVTLMMYFKNVHIPMNEIDVTQISKIKDFKKSLGEKGGLYWEYNNTEDFKDLVRNHLNLLLPSLLEKNALLQREVAQNDPQKSFERVQSDNSLMAISPDDVEETEETGYIELLLDVQENFGEITSIVSRITSYMNDVNAKTNKASISINKASNLPEYKRLAELRRIIDKIADDMLLFVGRVHVELPLFREAITKGFNAFSNAYVVNKSLISSDEEMRDLENQKNQLRDSIVGGIDSFNSLKEIIVGVPGMTTKFNKARKEYVKVINKLIAEYDLSLSLLNDIDNR